MEMAMWCLLMILAGIYMHWELQVETRNLGRQKNEEVKKFWRKS